MENENECFLEEGEIPGTAKIRKICVELSSIEILKLSASLAKDGYDKKLWSVLSRVYENKKGFAGEYDAVMDQYVSDILNSQISGELKLQVFTSFKLSSKLLPSLDDIKKYVDECSSKRINIAAYFIAEYGLEKEFYKLIIQNKEIFKIVVKNISAESLVLLFEEIIDNEKKEAITGAIRALDEQKVKIDCKDKNKLKELSEKVFDSKEVFFTTKLLFCITFNVPFANLPYGRDLEKILKISINYEERITKEFVRKYNLKFDVSDEALCRYYIGNKKATKEKTLVTKFASHFVNINDEEVKRKLLRGAFKRGGYFRMYAGCMQDGKIDIDKLHRFRYTDEDISWCSGLAGLK